MRAEAPRPAFYALAPGGWRDYVTLLHLPYTAWHLAYVAIGAAVASADVEAQRLLPTLAAFAVGIGAQVLDELHGRPLGTAISRATLIALAVGSLAAAVAVGRYGALAVNGWIALFIVVGAAAAVSYNLELPGGRLHGDVQFALAWGSFPVLTGAFAAAERLAPAALLAAAFAFLTALAQRRLSTLRDVRRRVAAVEGSLHRHDGTSEPVTRETLVLAEERALRLRRGPRDLAAALLSTRMT